MTGRETLWAGFLTRMEEIRMNPDYREIAERYTKTREASINLHTKIVKLLAKEDINLAGRALGLMGKGGTLVFDNEAEIPILMDHAIHGVFRKGENLLDRCLKDVSGRFSADEIFLLEAMSKAHYAFLIVESCETGVGVHALDFTRSQRIFLADSLFSQLAYPDAAMVGRVIPFPGFHMTTGAMLPVTLELLKGLDKLMPKEACELSRENEANFFAKITRTLLARGASSSIAYGEPEDDIDMLTAIKADMYPDEPTDTSAGNRRKVGRNDPCPCGSGKKHKKCCLLK